MSLIYKDIFSTPGLERPSLASLARSLAISPSNLTLNRECPMTKGAPKAETRSLHRPKLSIEHFAFMRGWCQGLDPRDLWMRYLARFGEFDARRCRSFIKIFSWSLAPLPVALVVLSSPNCSNAMPTGWSSLIATTTLRPARSWPARNKRPRTRKRSRR